MKRVSILAAILCCTLSTFAQSFVISGHITDEKTGENLIGATLFDPVTMTGTTSNTYGFYSLKFSKGEHDLQCSLLGFTVKNIHVNLEKDLVKDIALSESSVELGEVVVTAASKDKAHQQNEFNAEVFTIASIRQLPAIFGENDVIKAMQRQSGVKSIGDGSSGMLVRGGTNDQNLILIDEAPIYNASHLFGLISIFNPDAINNVTFYKSNMPAQYGSRVSSVLDCMMKEGNLNRHDFSFSVSPFAATLSANGPIVKQQAAYFLSVRHSLLDLVMKPSSLMQVVPGFYDVNMKVNAKLGANDRLFASYYMGNDAINSLYGLYNTWGNKLGTLRWNHNFGSRWFMNTSLIVSDYQNDLSYKEKKRQYHWHTGLSDINLKVALSYYLAPDCELQCGAGSIYHRFIPGESDTVAQSIARVNAFEHSAYLLNDWKPYRWLGLNYGLRVSAFQPMKGDNKTFFYLEPRASVSIKPTEATSFKLAYARNAQYMQVLQNNAVSYSSLETWFPAIDGMKPVVTDVFSTGWFQQIGKQFSTSVELYYKAGQNQIDYIDHARLINNPNVVSQVRSGISKAYGVEFNFSKDVGKFTGSASYAFSRVKYQIAGINNGAEYPAISDMPHDVRVMGHYQFNPRWDVSLAWQYSSGRPITIPLGFYEFGEIVVPIYSDRNASRTPAYHRMDFSCGYTSRVYRKGFSWSTHFGVYNLYDRKNPIGYQFEYDYSDKKVRINQYSLFGILPNVSVKLNW